MAMSIGEIDNLLREAFPDAEIEIKSLAADDDHYAAIVVSESFRGKTRVQQHKMVYDALGDKIGNDLHALALQTSAPDQGNA